MHQHTRRNQKLKVLTLVYADLEKRLQAADMIRVNEEWDKMPRSQKKWSSKAYFLQDFQKYAPEHLVIQKSQRAGTFVKKA